MSDILNKNEVDALLAAVEKGEIRAPAAPADAGAAQPYDFRRPERMGKDRLRVLTAVHETFARGVAAHLGGLLRRAVEVRLAAIEQSTLGEFAAATPSPACLIVLSAAPLPGNPVLEIAPALVFPILDRLLGGSGENVAVPARPLTEIEARLLQKTVTPMTALLREAWSVIEKIDFAVVETRSASPLVPAGPAHEPVVLAVFDVRLGELSAPMRLCLPCATIESALGRVAAGAHAAEPAAAGEASPERIARSLAEAPLNVVADLAVTQITVRELMELEPGDLLKTDADVDSEAIVYVEGVPKFKGKPGRNRRNKAVLITRPIDPGKTR